MTARQRAADITERDFTAQVIELARLLGYRAAHFRPAWTGRGWRTPVQGDGAGFPDLVLLRSRDPRRLVIAELKAGRGQVTPEQRAWLDDFRLAGVECHIWRPEDLDAIATVLR